MKGRVLHKVLKRRIFKVSTLKANRVSGSSGETTAAIKDEAESTIMPRRKSGKNGKIACRSIREFDRFPVMSELPALYRLALRFAKGRPSEANPSFCAQIREACGK
jgi:hypothetical protein